MLHIKNCKRITSYMYNIIVITIFVKITIVTFMYSDYKISFSF